MRNRGLPATRVPTSGSGATATSRCRRRRSSGRRGAVDFERPVRSASEGIRGPTTSWLSRRARSIARIRPTLLRYYDGRSYGVDFYLRQLEHNGFSGWVAYSYGVTTRERNDISVLAGTRPASQRERRRDVRAGPESLRVRCAPGDRDRNTVHRLGGAHEPLSTTIPSATCGAEQAAMARKMCAVPATANGFRSTGGWT